MPAAFTPRSAVKIFCGFSLLAIGGVLSLPGVPGPGFALILLGLVMLRDHFAWAERGLVWLRNKVHKLRRKPDAQ